VWFVLAAARFRFDHRVSFSFVCGLLQVRAGIVLEPSDQRLELSGLLSYTCGGF
jgi:hypothetical protein